MNIEQGMQNHEVSFHTPNPLFNIHRVNKVFDPSLLRNTHKETVEQRQNQAFLFTRKVSSPLLKKSMICVTAATPALMLASAV